MINKGLSKGAGGFMRLCPVQKGHLSHDRLMAGGARARSKLVLGGGIPTMYFLQKGACLIDGLLNGLDNELNSELSMETALPCYIVYTMMPRSYDSIRLPAMA